MRPLEISFTEGFFCGLEISVPHGLAHFVRLVYEEMYVVY